MTQYGCVGAGTPSRVAGRAFAQERHEFGADALAGGQSAPAGAVAGPAGGAAPGSAHAPRPGAPRASLSAHECESSPQLSSS